MPSWVLQMHHNVLMNKLSNRHKHNVFTIDMARGVVAGGEGNVPPQILAMEKVLEIFCLYNWKPHYRENLGAKWKFWASNVWGNANQLLPFERMYYYVAVCIMDLVGTLHLSAGKMLLPVEPAVFNPGRLWIWR